MWTDEQKPHAPADGNASLWLVRRGRPMHSLQRECGYWYSPKGMLPSSVSKRPTGEQKKGNKEIKHTFPQIKTKTNATQRNELVWYDGIHGCIP